MTYSDRHYIKLLVNITSAIHSSLGLFGFPGMDRFWNMVEQSFWWSLAIITALSLLLPLLAFLIWIWGRLQASVDKLFR